MPVTVACSRYLCACLCYVCISLCLPVLLFVYISKPVFIARLPVSLSLSVLLPSIALCLSELVVINISMSVFITCYQYYYSVCMSLLLVAYISTLVSAAFYPCICLSLSHLSISRPTRITYNLLFSRHIFISTVCFLTYTYMTTCVSNPYCLYLYNCRYFSSSNSIVLLALCDAHLYTYSNCLSCFLRCVSGCQLVSECASGVVT